MYPTPPIDINLSLQLESIPTVVESILVKGLFIILIS